MYKFIALIALTLTLGACGEQIDDHGTGNTTPPANNGGSGGSTGGSGGGSSNTGGTGGSSTGGGTYPERSISCELTAENLVVVVKGPIEDNTLADLDGQIGNNAPLPGNIAYVGAGGANVGSWDPRATSHRASWVNKETVYTLLLPRGATHFNLALLDTQGHYKWLKANAYAPYGVCYYAGTELTVK